MRQIQTYRLIYHRQILPVCQQHPILVRTPFVEPQHPLLACKLDPDGLFRVIERPVAPCLDLRLRLGEDIRLPASAHADDRVCIINVVQQLVLPDIIGDKPAAAVCSINPDHRHFFCNLRIPAFRRRCFHRRRCRQQQKRQQNHQPLHGSFLLMIRILGF